MTAIRILTRRNLLKKNNVYSTYKKVLNLSYRIVCACKKSLMIRNSRGVRHVLSVRPDDDKESCSYYITSH